MSTALGLEVFEDFAEFAMNDLIVVDQDTNLRAFSRKLRWNQAYYRLA